MELQKVVVNLAEEHLRRKRPKQEARRDIFQ